MGGAGRTFVKLRRKMCPPSGAPPPEPNPPFLVVLKVRPILLSFLMHLVLKRSWKMKYKMCLALMRVMIASTACSARSVIQFLNSYSGSSSYSLEVPGGGFVLDTTPRTQAPEHRGPCRDAAERQR